MQPVKRSGIFISVLLSLFMFQSLWNVAAAFCDHENITSSSQGLIRQHFGHHNAPNCKQDQLQHQQGLIGVTDVLDHVSSQQQNIQLNDFLSHLEDDHSDHLPSFAHYIVVDTQQQATQPKFVAYPESTFSDWDNLYQSPHLFAPNPPPISSPL